MGNRSLVTQKDLAALSYYTTDERVGILTLYLLDPNEYNMQDVAEIILDDHNPQASQRVSLVTRSYGFQDRNAGRYYNVATREDIEDFVRTYNPERTGGLAVGTFDAFLKTRIDQRRRMQDTGRIYQTEQTQSGSAFNVSDSPSESRSHFSMKRLLKPFLLLAAVVFVLKSCLGGEVDFSLPGFMTGKPEAFWYEGTQFTGYQSGGKPKGICIGLETDSDFEIGNFKSGKLSGYGMRYGEEMLEMGSFKKGELKGVGLITNADGMLFGKIKKGKLSGYGISYADGRMAIVKSSWSKVKEVAVRDDASGVWRKTGSGKELKVKDNQYKGITFDGSSVTIKGNTLSMSGVYVYFSNEKVRMRTSTALGDAEYDGRNTKGVGKVLKYTPHSSIVYKIYKASGNGKSYTMELD